MPIPFDGKQDFVHQYEERKICITRCSANTFSLLHFRYMCKEAPYGGELAFSEENVRDMHNADLCDTVGNLVNRATNLCKKYNDSLVADVPPPSKLPVPNLNEVIDLYVQKMDEFDLQGAANVAMEAFRNVNKYLQDEAPWLKKGDEHTEFRQVVVRATLEAIYSLSHLLLPFLPIGASKIFEKLGKKPVPLKDLGRDCRNLEVGGKIQIGEVLYEKSVSDDEIKDKKAAGAKKKESYEEAQRRKKEKKAKEIAASKKGQQNSAASDQPEFTKIDIRVGKIIKVWNHETADKLYCEQIDLAEETGPREIASGLREHYTLEEMQDREVLVVCNLKAAKIVGFVSNGMVLAAKVRAEYGAFCYPLMQCRSHAFRSWFQGADGKKVELVSPPPGSEIGERVFIDGLEGEPFSSAQVKKRKVWDTVAKGLKTGEGGVATWEGKTIQTSKGPCKAATLVGAPIS